MRKKLVLFFGALVLLLPFSKGQDYPYDIEFREFVRYDKNHIEFFGDSSSFDSLFQKLDDLIFAGKGQINIIHIGGSHIQGGALPGHFAERLQTMAPGLKGSRGFVFPYNLSRTNTPRNYVVRHSGSWSTCRSVQRRRECTLGLLGISATTQSENATLKIYLEENAYLPYDFNRVKIFHDMAASNFDMKIANCKQVERKVVNDTLGYTLFDLKTHKDVLNLELEKTDTLQDHFTLYGISLENDEPGITYHGIGVNGASIPSYLRCDLLEEHTQGLSPDWFILTLGTNDAYTRKFNPDYFQTNYDSLLTRLKAAAPNAAFLLTVPNDSYLYRRYVNRNTAKVGEVIRKIAKKHNCAVWDFYNIMGGLNSVNLWYKDGLTARDRIHFHRNGYFLQADLLFNAFLRKYDKFLERKQTMMSENQ